MPASSATQRQGKKGPEPVSHIRKKQLHCTPTCAIPSSAAPHANGLISRQHPTSVRLVGRIRMFAMAQVPDVVPSRTK